ncbi:hypothetical protein SLS55_007310 [Diplodia seriata]|uniref:DUF8035 domain-containing protein n=1 Tax=Diplodia seriata TaxID=420778 RepID=A0ABR3CBX2_9PEZI
MGSRRAYPTAELYDERERDYYGGGRRSQRDYEELDAEIRRPRSEFGGRRPGPQPEFLREDYGRTAAGPLVVSDRRTVREDDWSPPPPKPRKDIERDEIIIRDSRKSERPPPSRSSQADRDDFMHRRGDPPPPPRPRPVEREEIVFRHEERSPPGRPKPRDRERDREEIIFRHEEMSPPPPARQRPREVEREEIVFRRGEGARSRPPPSEVDREEIRIRRNEGPPSHRPREVEREEISIRRSESEGPSRHRSHSRPGDLVAREKEEFVIRRRPPPPPSPPQEKQQEIIIRRTERSPSPDGENGRYEEDITFERDVRERKAPADDLQISRRRSVSLPRRKHADGWDVDDEADYYNRKVMERAYMGEAHNGATKDWAIVDVPPGTNRVRMEGMGGGAQEVTWQRYNGVRRSKFLSDDREYATDWGAPAQAPPPMPAPSKTRPPDMWTEITKDLVLKEAIDAMGYDYEETDYFFYVMDYLRYEDVLHLVEISDDIRRERRQRIREIEYERKKIEAPPPKKEYDYYEREVIYERERERDDRRGRYR